MLRDTTDWWGRRLTCPHCSFNIDETWCKVRIKFEGDGTKLGHYYKKYVWVIVNWAIKVVYFLYDNDENDSRGRRPIEKFLSKSMKSLQSGGYLVYKLLTNDLPVVFTYFAGPMSGQNSSLR